MIMLGTRRGNKKDFKISNICIQYSILILFLLGICQNPWSQTASDNASNYSGSWNNGSNFGSGFGAWNFTVGANSGAFIGNPANNGMGTTGIGTTAFGMYATSAGYFNAARTLNSAMAIGDILSFYWAVNWDTGGGNKGIDFKSGGTTILNVNMGGSATITAGGVNTQTLYGTIPMLVTIMRTTSNTYQFTITSRSGGSTYSAVVTNSSAIDNLNFYIGGQSGSEGERNMYINHLNHFRSSFRSAGTGNWSALATWEMSTNGGTTWTPTSVVPNNTLGAVTIQNGHTVTASAAVSTDETTINNGGILAVAAGVALTISNGTPAIDLQANGTLRNAGTVTTTGNLTFGATGVYEHNYTTTAGTIPTATWSAGSTCAVIGYTTNTNATVGVNQAFSNFTWNCPGQTGNINLTGGLTNVTGNFSLLATNTGQLRLAGAAGVNLNVGGNFSVSGGTLMCSATVGSSVSINIGGNFSMSGGTINISSGTAASNSNVFFVFNSAVSTQTITQTGGTISGSTNNFINWQSSTTGTGKVQLATNFNLGTTSGNFVISPGATVDFQTFQLSGTFLTGKAFLCNSNVTGSGTLMTAHAAGINTTGATGSIITSGTRTFNAPNLVYNGSVAQVTGNVIGSIRSLTINNAAGVTMSASCTMDAAGILTLTSGKLFVNSGGQLLMNNTSPSAVASASASSYVVTDLVSVSNFRRTIPSTGLPATFLFPVGTAGGYAPVNYTFSSNSASMIIRMMIDPASPPSITGMTSYIANRYWYTDLMAGGGNTYSYTAQYNFVAGDLVGSLSSIRLGYWGVNWTLDAGSSASGTTIQSGSLTQATGNLNGNYWAGVSSTSLPPTITSFTPTSGASGTSVTITGTNFTGASAVSFGGTAATSYTVVSATSITATVANGTTGVVSVTTAAGTANSSSNFTFLASTPTITSFTPTSSAQAGTVAITGTNFTGATAVSFGGTAATSFTVNSATSITATVASGTSGSVSVTTSAGTATLAGFTFISAPTITSFTPTSASSGSSVTITGTNLTGATTVSFGGTAATSFTVNSATSITAVVASGASGSVSVTTPGGTATLAGFTYLTSPPTITSFTPTSAASGATVSITGTDFTGATAVSFGGTAATSFTVNSATSITATIASGTSGSVSVTTPSGTATLAGFTYIPAPTITSFTPTSAGNAATVTITGTNFTGATAVTFGGTAATSYTVVSATSITAVVAAGTSGSVAVTTPGGTATLSGFTFIAAPTITSFTPTTAASGTSVTITGTNFTGATAVSFGGVAATSYTVVSATSITAVVATGASGSVVVTTPGGTATLAGFTFAPLPSITSFSPTATSVGGWVTITGTDFTGATAVSFGGTAATSFTVVSATSITAFVGAGANGSVSVTTPGGTASLSGFSVIPTLVSWEPNGSTSYGVSPLVGTLGSNVASGSLSRVNVSLAGTAANNAWGGSGWSQSAIAPTVTGATPVILFTVRVSPGYGMNLTQIAPFNYRRSGGGPTAGLFQYSIDGVNYTTISTLSFSFNGSPGAPIAPIDLSGISELQNVNNCTTVTFRIVPYGATSAAGTFYIPNLNASNPDLGIAGTVVALSAPTVSITSSDADNIACAGTSITLTASASAPTTFTYQWKKDGVNIVGATSSTYTSSSLSSGSYSCSIDACGVVANSNALNTTIISNPMLSLVSSSGVNSCSGTTPTFTASGATTYDFFLNGTSQGNASTTNTFTPSSPLNSGDIVCVRGYNPLPFTIDGDLTDAYWGSPLATSSGGPSSSGFGVNRMDALYLKNGFGYLFGGIAGNLENNSGNKVLLFIDCISGGYNNLSSWIYRSNAPYNSMKNLNGGIQFDAGFEPDFILGINISNNVLYFDLYNMQTNTNTYLGASGTALYGYQSNSGVGDFTKGFEFSIPINLLGNYGASMKAFGMLVNDPGFINATFLSNQFLTRANNGEVNYQDGAVNFGLAAPNPVSYSVIQDCYAEQCITIQNSLVPSVSIASSDANNSICQGESVTFTATPTNGGTAPAYQWKVNGNNSGTNAATFTTTILANNDEVTVVMTANNTCQTSATATSTGITTAVTNNVTPSVTIAASTTDICPGAGTSVTFTATPTNGGTPSYQWKKNGTNVGTNSATYTSTTLAGGDVITVVMTATNTCQTSPTATSAGTTINALTVYTYYLDLDGDGYGPTNTGISDCSQPNGYVEDGGDCDDSNMDAFPTALEICNGLDDDCNGVADNDVVYNTYYQDVDGDGFGNSNVTVSSCDLVDGYVEMGNDCDDNNVNVNPNATELCSTNFDDDCDGLVNEVCVPGNDHSGSPSWMSPSATLICNNYAGTLLAATPSNSFGTSSWVSGPDVWYYFTANGPGVTIRGATTENDIRMELRTMSGTLLKTANSVSGIGDEYLNFGGLTQGVQYYVRIINVNSAQVGGAFSLCVRRLVSSPGFNTQYTPSLITSGCQNLYCVTALGATSYGVSLVASGQPGAPVLNASGQVVPMHQLVGPSGERFQYNTTYNASITVNYVMILGDGSTENILITQPAGQIVVGQCVDVDVASAWTCPATLPFNRLVKANTWLCDAVQYQWKFERMLNGQLFLQNGNPVTITGFGAVGSVNFYATAALGFGSGTEWRVQIRPIFANGVVGDYGTDYQCVKMRGIAAAAPMIQDQTMTKNLGKDLSRDLEIWPNPGNTNEIHLRWEFEEFTTVVIWDAAGRVVQEYYLSNEDGMQEIIITPDNLIKGLYLIEVKTENKTSRKRYLKL